MPKKTSMLSSVGELLLFGLRTGTKYTRECSSHGWKVESANGMVQLLNSVRGDGMEGATVVQRVIVLGSLMGGRQSGGGDE